MIHLSKRDATLFKELQETSLNDIMMSAAISDLIEFCFCSENSLIENSASAIQDIYLEQYDFNPIFDTKKISSSLILDDPYMKCVNFKREKLHHWTLDKREIKPFEVMIYDDTYIENDSEVTKLVSLDKTVKVPCVIQDDKIWMSIVPHEIITMRKPIADAKGRVLVLGVGLGYYAYRVALKSSVRRVVIIESDKNAIELFNCCILPQFEKSVRDKITILENDAFRYLAELNEEFDYVFADIYRTVEDGLDLYYRFLPFERKYKNIKFSYWIERSLLVYYRRLVIMILGELIKGSEAIESDEPIYIDTRKFFLNTEITSYEMIKEFLSEERLYSLIREISSVRQSDKNSNYI